MPDFLTESLVALSVALRAGVNALEVVLLVAAALCVNRGWLGAPPWCGALENAGRRLARRPRLAVLGVILLTVVARLALLPLRWSHCPTRADPTNSAICSWEIPSPTAA
jgi:hypothetical protein